MSRFFRSVLVFFLSLIWLAWLMPWDGFADPDAFYHAKASLLLWERGPLQIFPWLDRTLLGTQFADLHFLFHVIVAPFVHFFGMFQGLRLATLILAALFLLVFDACLRWIKLPHAGWWTMLLATTQPFLIRLLLAKATPLALIWYVLGLSAAWKRKPWLVALATCGFALSHGGWIYLVGSIVLLMAGDATYRYIVQSASWRQAFSEAGWRESLMGFFGVGVGVLLHPNARHLFLFTWTQVVTIGLGTPFQHVMLGREWLPAEPMRLFSSLAPIAIALVLGFAGLAVARRSGFDHAVARLTSSVGWIVAVLFALTLKSQRTAEYLAPMLVWWCAALWALIDVRALWSVVRESIVMLGRRVSVLIFVMVALSCVTLVIREVAEVRGSFHPVGYLDAVYQASLSTISKRAQPGDRVFHSSWDEFPMLFAADDRLRYVSGLDPTFLYVASPSSSDAVRDLTWDATSSTSAQAWEVIHDDWQVRFVFVSKKNHQKFLHLLQSDSRYRRIADAEDSAAFEVIP